MKLLEVVLPIRVIKKLNVFLIVLMVSLLPLSSQAGSFQINGVSPLQFRVDTSGQRFSVSVNPGEITQFPSACSSSSSDRVFYVLNRNVDNRDVNATDVTPKMLTSAMRRQTGFDQMFTIVMAAKLNNSKISVWIDDTECSSNRPVANLIRLD